jgi:hypothetical protein
MAAFLVHPNPHHVEAGIHPFKTMPLDVVEGYL